MTKDKKSATPSNLDLAREARVTKDCERQVLLASHPSRVVRLELVRNAFLCAAAVEILGGELDALRREVQGLVKGINQTLELTSEEPTVSDIARAYDE